VSSWLLAISLVLGLTPAPANPQSLASAAPHAATGQIPTEQLQTSGKATVGQPAPWFAGWTAQDRVLNRTRLLKQSASGHALLFFATWCKPCEVGLAQVQAQHAALQAAGLNVILVAVGQSAEDVQPWLKARKLDAFPLLIDRFGTIALAFGAQTIADGTATTQLPRTALLAPDGTVRALLGREGPDFIELLQPDPPL
jgi:peroxiredoxin